MKYTNIKFETTNKSYTFGTEDLTIKVNDLVVVETNRGMEIGTCVSELRDTSNLSEDMEVKMILRKATPADIKQATENEDMALEAMKICQDESDKLNLEMRVVSAEYTLDRTKVTFIYVANERVDFRELLKVLASIFKCRIELRQIGARDKAKIVSGIGVCGHELCCGRFLNDFDMVSFNMAKNQGLALNISKLSGHCGKLMCCLKYEDEAYTDAKRDMPKLNTPCTYNGDNWKLNSINIINNTVRLESSGNYITLSFHEFFKNADYKDKKEVNLDEYKEPEEIKEPEVKEEKFFDTGEIISDSHDDETAHDGKKHHHKKNHHHNNRNKQEEKPETSERVFQPKDNKSKENKPKDKKPNDFKPKDNKPKENRQAKETKPVKENSPGVQNDQAQNQSGGNKNHHRRRHFRPKNKNVKKDAE